MIDGYLYCEYEGKGCGSLHEVAEGVLITLGSLGWLLGLLLGLLLLFLALLLLLAQLGVRTSFGLLGLLCLGLNLAGLLVLKWLLFLELAGRPDFFLGIFVGRLDCLLPIVCSLLFLLPRRPEFLLAVDAALDFLAVHALGLLHPFFLLVAVRLIGATFLFKFGLLSHLFFFCWFGVLLDVGHLLLEFSRSVVIVRPSVFVFAGVDELYEESFLRDSLLNQHSAFLFGGEDVPT